MTRKELMKLSERELFKACRNQGLDNSGSKSDLANRLLAAQPEPVEPGAPPEAPGEPPEEPAPEAS